MESSLEREVQWQLEGKGFHRIIEEGWGSAGIGKMAQQGKSLNETTPATHLLCLGLAFSAYLYVPKVSVSLKLVGIFLNLFCV